jgi:hypothetical protein
MNLDEDFLQEIFEIRVAADHSRKEARHVEAVELEEIAKRAWISRSAPADQIVLRAHGV